MAAIGGWPGQITSGRDIYAGTPEFDARYGGDTVAAVHPGRHPGPGALRWVAGRYECYECGATDHTATN